MAARAGLTCCVEWDAPPTLPGVLRDAGYQTAIVGRNMPLHPVRKRYGFDEMVIPPGDYEKYVSDHQQGDRADFVDDPLYRLLGGHTGIGAGGMKNTHVIFTSDHSFM